MRDMDKIEYDKIFDDCFDFLLKGIKNTTSYHKIKISYSQVSEYLPESDEIHVRDFHIHEIELRKQDGKSFQMIVDTKIDIFLNDNIYRAKQTSLKKVQEKILNELE